MSIDHHFYMDTAASRHELREVLMHAGRGFKVQPEDWRVLSTGGLGSGAFNEATRISIIEVGSDRGRPDNGVIATRSIGFSYCKSDLDRFNRDVTLSIVALMRAYPEADAFWEGWGDVPMLLRIQGRIVLAEAETEPREFWSTDQPSRALVDLPYVVEPLGPWWKD